MDEVTEAEVKLDNSRKILYAYHISNIEVRMHDNKIRIRANKYTSIPSWLWTKAL